VLPKQHRLDRKEFDVVWKKGRRIRGQTLSLIVLPAEDKNEPSKIGIIVTKKVAKLAVDRNKLKRQIRNVLNPHMLKFLPTGQRTVVMVFPVEKPRKYQAIKEELTTLFSKI